MTAKDARKTLVMFRLNFCLQQALLQVYVLTHPTRVSRDVISHCYLVSDAGDVCLHLDGAHGCGHRQCDRGQLGSVLEDVNVRRRRAQGTHGGRLSDRDWRHQRRHIVPACLILSFI